MAAWLLCAALLGAAVFFGTRSGTVITQVNEIAVMPVVSRVPKTATLLFAGDIMLSRSVGDLLAAKGDWRWPFRSIASVTAGADLAFANLETTVSTRGITAGCVYCFRADPRVVAGLTYAGFDVLSVANNHIWDYGAVAFTDTLANLASAGISAVGGGENGHAARAPIIRTVGTARVALLGYTNLLPASACAGEHKPGANCFDATTMAADIAGVRKQADIVVVSFHAGEEYHPEASDWQRRTYRAAVDAGADLVIGHHPHVPEPLERYGNGWIVYSLGNFIFDQNFSEETMRGLMLSVTLKGAAIDAVQELPIAISRQYQPSLSPAGAGTAGALR